MPTSKSMLLAHAMFGMITLSGLSSTEGFATSTSSNARTLPHASSASSSSTSSSSVSSSTALHYALNCDQDDEGCLFDSNVVSIGGNNRAAKTGASNAPQKRTVNYAAASSTTMNNSFRRVDPHSNSAPPAATTNSYQRVDAPTSRTAATARTAATNAYRSADTISNPYRRRIDPHAPAPAPAKNPHQRVEHEAPNRARTSTTNNEYPYTGAIPSYEKPAHYNPYGHSEHQNHNHNGAVPQQQQYHQQNQQQQYVQVHGEPSTSTSSPFTADNGYADASSSSSVASVAVMITHATKRVLIEELGYSRQHVKAMDPETARGIVHARIRYSY